MKQSFLLSLSKKYLIRLFCNNSLRFPLRVVASRSKSHLLTSWSLSLVFFWRRISTELLGFTKMWEFGRLQSVLFALNAVLGHSRPLEDVIISSSLICRPSDCVQFKPLLLLSILSLSLAHSSAMRLINHPTCTLDCNSSLIINNSHTTPAMLFLFLP